MLLVQSRTIGDRSGEAKASGNLGNTLKLLEKFDEAVACCQRQLDIYKELDDKATAFSILLISSFTCASSMIACYVYPRLLIYLTH